MATINRKDITAKLTKAAVMHMARYGFAIHTEVGLAKGAMLRADLLCLNFKRKIVIIEVKSCYADFATDSKWPRMLSLCDQLVFVIPQSVWDAGKVRPQRGVGVLILDETTGHLKSVQRATTQEIIDDETRDYLILKMAYRSADFTKRTVPRRLKIYLNK